MVSLSYHKIASFSFSYNKKTKNAKTFTKIKLINVVDTQYICCVMFCSVKKNMSKKYTVKPMNSLILTSLYVCDMGGGYIWGGFIMGAQIYKEKDKS